MMHWWRAIFVASIAFINLNFWITRNRPVSYSEDAQIFAHWQTWAAEIWKSGQWPLWHIELGLAAWLEPLSGYASWLTLPLFFARSQELGLNLTLGLAVLVTSLGAFAFAYSVKARPLMAVFAALTISSRAMAGMKISSPPVLLAEGLSLWTWWSLLYCNSRNSALSRIVSALAFAIMISMGQMTVAIVTILAQLIFSLLYFSSDHSLAMKRLLQVTLSSLVGLLISAPSWWPIFSSSEPVVALSSYSKANFQWSGQWLFAWCWVGLIATIVWRQAKIKNHIWLILTLVCAISLLKLPTQANLYSHFRGLLNAETIHSALIWQSQLSFIALGLCGVSRLLARFVRSHSWTYLCFGVFVFHILAWIAMLSKAKSLPAYMQLWTPTEYMIRTNQNLFAAVVTAIVGLTIYFLSPVQRSRTRPRSRSAYILSLAAVAVLVFIDSQSRVLVKKAETVAQIQTTLEDLRRITIAAKDGHKADLGQITYGKTLRPATTMIEAQSLLQQRGSATQPYIVEQKEAYLGGRPLGLKTSFWSEWLPLLAIDTGGAIESIPVQILNEKRFPQSYEFEATSSGASLIVFRQYFTPAWRYYLNDKEVPSFRVDSIYQGIFVKNGQQQVRAELRVNEVEGAKIAIYLGLIAIIFWAFIAYRKRRYELLSTE